MPPCTNPLGGTDEFIRRFLLHGFHRIRHYGLLAGSARKASVARARDLLNVAAPSDDGNRDEPDDFRPSCPCCGGRMCVHAERPHFVGDDLVVVVVDCVLPHVALKRRSPRTGEERGDRKQDQR